ncbi:MAG: TonB-dependent receptor domain-containing protein [Steroidobacteraceae bacterium]
MIPAAPARAGVLEQVTTFHIPAEKMTRALLDLGRQAHIQVILREAPLQGVRSAGLEGRYTVRQALEKILRGSALTYALSANTLEIFPKTFSDSNARSPSVAGAVPSGSNPLTESEKSRLGERTPSRESRAMSVPPDLREVIVTGTHISGGPPPSEPMITITQQDIRESGYQSVEQLMDSLPENFNSMGSEENGSQTELDGGNFGYGAAVDLLGLGYDSSLVLVNGHRLAPAGINGAFTDIAVIPLSAVKRVEIVTDGASAIYGADAIGGVVNYILRNKQEGGETSLEYGSVTKGSMKDYRASTSYGFNWSSGSALLSYEYHDETPLNVLDRPFSAPSAPGMLTPGTTQSSVYLSATDLLTDRWRIDPSVLYSHRRVTEEGAAGTQPFYGYADAAEFSYAVGSTIFLSKSWQLHARVSYGGNDTKLSTSDGALSGDNRLSTASVDASGAILSLPAGELKAAAGVQARYEKLSSLFTGQYIITDINKHRTVNSAFLETQIPLLASDHDGVRRQLMTLDLAGRVDHYSDFGTAENPRAGLAWMPVRGLKLRGTVSSSFKAPNFYELYGAQNSLLVNSPEPTLPPTSSVAVLYLIGSNPNLTAEKATEWTTGIDYSPPYIEGLSANVTFYHVNFKERIVDPGIPLVASLDQGAEYAPYIQMDPTLAQLNYWLSPQYLFQNITTLPGFGPARVPAQAVAIVDGRFHNVGQSRTSGLLTTVNYQSEFRGFHYHVGVNGAYILDFKNTSVPGATAFSVLNTLNNPVNFRARVTAGVQRALWSLTAFLNYTNRYRDLTTGAPVPVASWTTVNLSASYQLFRGSGDWHGARLYVSCVNCLDRAPPAVRLISDYLGYDPANANALGRFLSATVTVRW